MSLREVFYVKKSRKFARLSLVHAGFEFPARFFRKDFGNFEVVETDGQAIEPVTVQQLILGVGETFEIRVPLDWEGSYCLIGNKKMGITEQVHALNQNLIEAI